MSEITRTRRIVNGLLGGLGGFVLGFLTSIFWLYHKGWLIMAQPDYERDKAYIKLCTWTLIGTVTALGGVTCAFFTDRSRHLVLTVIILLFAWLLLSWLDPNWTAVLRQSETHR